MPRVKRAVQHLKRRKKLLSKTKGMRWGRKNRIRLARPAVLKAGAYAYRDRRTKKREFRNLWAIKINAAIRPLGMNYSRLMHALKLKGVTLDRKSLAFLAEFKPAVFRKVVEAVK